MLWLAHMGLTLVAARLVRLSPGWPTVFVASILPDLVDKPLSLLLPWWSGRGYAHTPLFALSLLLAGLATPHRRTRGVLIVFGFGSALHLLLDGVTSARLLAWPLLGWRIEDHASSLEEYVGYLMRPSNWVAEAVGLSLMVALAVAYRLRARRQRVADPPVAV